VGLHPSSPLPAGTNVLGKTNPGADITIIQNRATLTATGTFLIPNVGRDICLLGFTINGTVSGTTPSLTLTIAEVDAVDGVTLMTAPGNSATMGPFTSTNHTQYAQVLSQTGALLVTWTITGTSPSFGGVDLWTNTKDAYLNSDGSNNTIIVGPVAAGSAIGTSSPVQMGLSDGSNVRKILGSSTGVQFFALATGVQADRAALTPGTADGLAVMGQSAGQGRILRAHRMGSLILPNKTILFDESVDVGPSVVDPSRWTTAVSGMTITQASGLITLNAASATASGNYAILTSQKQFAFGRNQAPLFLQAKVLISQTTNAFCEIGFGAPATTTAVPANAPAYLRVSVSAVGKIVVQYNGTETTGGTTATLVTTTYYLINLWIEDGQARIQIMSSADASAAPLLDTQIQLPIGSPLMGSTNVTHAPVFARVYTSGVAGAAPQMKIAQLAVFQTEWLLNKTWIQQLAGAGKSAGWDVVAQASTSNFAVNTAPSTANALSAATPVYSTLDGEYAFAMVVGAEQAYPLFAKAPPLGYTLNVSDAFLPAPFVSVALGGTATVLGVYLLRTSGTNLGTATIYEEVFFGFFTAPALAAVGTLFTGGPYIYASQAPLLVVPYGQFAVVAVKVLSGAATGTVRGMMKLPGVLE
jgi:hypothetical protein